MTDPTWLAEQFEAHRSHLRGVAYRMLGSTTEADDAVQDAWLRFNRADPSGVHDLRAWLTTVVSRLCMDMLRARIARREEPMGIHVPDPIVTGPDAGNPEEEAMLADSVGLAMLIVLETLTPAERLAFVLHDTFGLPFDEIGSIIDRTPAAARKLASRARGRVRGATSTGQVSLRRQRELVTAFVRAGREGDFEALLRILDSDVVVLSDGGEAGPAAALSRRVTGASAVVEQAMSFRHLAPGARTATVNGSPGLAVFSGDRPFAILGFGFRNDRIAEIEILLDPARLDLVDLSAVSGPGDGRPS